MDREDFLACCRELRGRLMPGDFSRAVSGMIIRGVGEHDAELAEMLRENDKTRCAILSRLAKHLEIPE